MFAGRARDYSAPVNFISAGLKKGAAEGADLDDSDDEEKPAKQDEFPKDFGPKKLKTVVSSREDCDLSPTLGRLLQPRHVLASAGGGSAGGRMCGFPLVVVGFCEVPRVLCSPFLF